MLLLTATPTSDDALLSPTRNSDPRGVGPGVGPGVASRDITAVSTKTEGRGVRIKPSLRKGSVISAVDGLLFCDPD